jgi:hypothetical protein
MRFWAIPGILALAVAVSSAQPAPASDDEIWAEFAAFSGRPAGVEIAFLTSDVPGSFAKAIAEGASPIAFPKRMPWGLEVAYVRAPEGTMVGFSEPPPPTTK